MVRDLLSGLIALALTFGGGYWYGKRVEAEAQQIEIDRLNAEARSKEEALTSAVNTTANVLRTTNEQAKIVAKERDSAITAGTYRMRIPVKTPECPVSTATDTSPASGNSAGEIRAELSPEAGKTLFAIAEEGDRAIRNLSACVELYNKVRESQK
jgi:hypothetical protein